MIKEIQNNQNNKTCYILRGLPGSGKSYLSTRIRSNYYVKKDETVVICSADEYFEQNGSYFWNPKYLEDAHKRCMFIFKEAISKNSSIIIIDNTNIKIKDFEQYEKIALENNYEVLIIDIFDNELTDEELFKRNKHNVPIKTITRMRNSYEQIDKSIKRSSSKIMNLDESPKDVSC